MITCLFPASFALAMMLMLPVAWGAGGEWIKNEVKMQEVLAESDLVWEILPTQWNEGAFLGNGQLGLMAYATPDDSRIDFHLGRVDVTDHRKAPDRKTSRGVQGAGVMYDFCRLNLGRMALRPAGKIKAGSLRVDLWNAELTGRILTDKGELKLRAATLYNRMIHVFEVTSTEADAAGQPLLWKWEFLPGNATSPRKQVFPDRPESAACPDNPPPRVGVIDGVHLCVQPLLAGGDYATAWVEESLTTENSSRLLVTTANEIPKSNESARTAMNDLRAAAKLKGETLFAAHRDWWHAYYQRTFLSIPDAMLQQFYWVQMFKLACSSRPDAPPIDVHGPFFRVNQWPGLWWNLNVQIAYWPFYTGNRLDLAANLIDEIDTHFDGLFNSFKSTPKLGDFAWVLHNYWLQFRYQGNWDAIQKLWKPKAKAVAADYLSRLKPNAKGELELPAMESPEYEGFKSYENSNYNLALLRWLLMALIECETHEPGSPDTELARWRETLTKLVPAPVNEDGLMIGSNRGVDKSHRHFSHLLGLYPLFVFDPDSAADREMLVRSLKHWHHIGQGKELAGYSFTGGAALYAALGMGDDAVTMLHQFLTGDTGISHFLPNTMYVEGGGRNPTLETPLSGASAIMDLLLQSWRGKIRVFPAVPTSWKDANFDRLLAMGGFEVSASRENGKTAWVAIESLAGEKCIVKVADWHATPHVISDSPCSIRQTSKDEFELGLRKGERAILIPAGQATQPVLRWIQDRKTRSNYFGLKPGQQLKTRQEWPELPVSPIPMN